MTAVLPISPLLRVISKVPVGSVDIQYISLCFCLEDVIEASSVFQMYWFVIISNYVILTYQIWNLILYYLFMNSAYNIIFVANSMYVICICFIKYDLGCKVDYCGLS